MSNLKGNIRDVDPAAYSESSLNYGYKFLLTLAQGACTLKLFMAIINHVL
jgi:hypothetical protein